MKADTQHLDFLISQYVDGCLEGTSRKTVEQHLLTNPEARELYAEHREVQDLLDDWGNRIPLINWNEFDRKLGERLESEAVEKERVSIFRRRMRPFAAAAALLIAAVGGYTWHALSHQREPVGPVAPGTVASIDSTRPTGGIVGPTAQPAMATATFPESGQTYNAPLASSASQPGDVAAFESLQSSVRLGMGGIRPLSNVVVTVPPSTQKDMKDVDGELR